MAVALLENASPTAVDSIQVVQPLFPHTAQLLGSSFEIINRTGRLFLSNAQASLFRKISVTDENGLTREIGIPNERSLTVYLDKKEVITLMTLGQAPELLVLGYLRNQELVPSLDCVASITVDWEVGAVAVVTHTGSAAEHQIQSSNSSSTKAGSSSEVPSQRRTVTSGCGQGSMFSHLMENIRHLSLPNLKVSQAQLFTVIDEIREHASVYKHSGSVHACALFALNTTTSTATLRIFVEDVGRHNALDTIAGWMWIQENLALYSSALVAEQASYLLYTTGRLTSEMMIKSAQMQVPIVMSRSGTTEMGLQVAEQLGICAIGRAAHRRYLCFTGGNRIVR